MANGPYYKNKYMIPCSLFRIMQKYLFFIWFVLCSNCVLLAYNGLLFIHAEMRKRRLYNCTGCGS